MLFHEYQIILIRTLTFFWTTVLRSEKNSKGLVCRLRVEKVRANKTMGLILGEEKKNQQNRMRWEWRKKIKLIHKTIRAIDQSFKFGYGRDGREREINKYLNKNRHINIDFSHPVPQPCFNKQSPHHAATAEMRNKTGIGETVLLLTGDGSARVLFHCTWGRELHISWDRGL